MEVDGSRAGCLGSFTRLKRQHQHLQLIISIGGGGASQNFASVAASAATRDNFGRSAKGLVDASGFDGIDSTSPPSSSRVYTNVRQSTGSILTMSNKAATSSRSSQPSGSISQTTAIYSRQHFPLANGRSRISTYTKRKTTSTLSTSWRTTLPVLGPQLPVIMLSSFQGRLVNHRGVRRLNT